MEKQGCRRRRVVLVPCPFQGHINPMLQLGTILHSKGFPITVAHTQLNFPDTSNYPDFMFIPLSDNFIPFMSEPGVFDNLVHFISDVNLNCRAPLLEALNQITEAEEPHHELPCVIYDALMYFAGAVACNLKLPSIILRTGNATNLLTYYAYAWLEEEGYIPLQDSKATELVPGLHPLRFKDLSIFSFKNLDPVLQVIANSRNVGKSSAIICNSMDYLEQSSLAQLQRHCRVPIFLTGPMHKMAPASSSSLLEEDTSCIAWLDKQTQNSVIYVSLGSVVSVDKKELAEMAWGLANSKQPFLWVVRPGSFHGSESIDFFPDGFKETVGDRGCIVKWAPQKKVLAHGAVGGFLSHCGWNSTLESTSEGVPMICRPYFADQLANTRYVSHVWRVGFELENDLEKGEIERAIKRLMVEEEGEELRQRAQDLKVKAEFCIRNGGTSYNSVNELVKLIVSV